MVRVLYLVIPAPSGQVSSIGKFGYGKAPASCKDFEKFVKKSCERYGTAFKDDKIY